MGLSRTGTKTTITGYKATGQATGAAYLAGMSYLADNSADRPAVEENVLLSGVAAGDQKYSGLNTLEDTALTTPNMKTKGTQFEILESVTQAKFWWSAGFLDIYNQRTTGASGNFAAGDNYRVHGFAKPAPTDWTKHFQWNLIWIYEGTGIGQVRKIQCVTDVGGEVRFWIKGAWETMPDTTSKYYILYSPLDIVYNNAAAGVIRFDPRNLIPLLSDITDEIQFGDNSTETGFGWADLLLHCTDEFATTMYQNAHDFYGKTDIFFGEFNPISELPVGSPAVARLTRSTAIASSIFGSKAGQTPSRRIAGSFAYGDSDKLSGGGYFAEYVYLADITGLKRSYHNFLKSNTPVSVDSEGDFLKYSVLPLNGNLMPYFTGNQSVRNAKGEWIGLATNAQGIGQFWANAENTAPGSAILTYIDCNFDLTRYFAGFATPVSAQISWAMWHQSTETDAWTGKISFQKTFNVKVIGENNNPLNGASVRIKDWGGNYNVATDTDSDGEITERELELGYWNFAGHVVYHNGLYYTCTVNHTAEAQYEPGIGANWATKWSQAGSGNKLKWRIDSKYTKTFVGGEGNFYSSMKNFGTWTIEVRKAGYKTYKETFEADMDAEGVVKVIQLERPNLSTIDSIKFDN